MVHRTAFFRPKDFPTKSKSGSSYRYCKSLGLSWSLHVFFGGQVAQLSKHDWLSSKKSLRCRKIKFIPIVWRLKLLNKYIYIYDNWQRTSNIGISTRLVTNSNWDHETAQTLPKLQETSVLLIQLPWQLRVLLSQTLFIVHTDIQNGWIDFDHRKWSFPKAYLNNSLWHSGYIHVYYIHIMRYMIYIYVYIYIFVYIYTHIYTIRLQLAVLLQHSMFRFRDGGEGRSGREIRRSPRAAPTAPTRYLGRPAREPGVRMQADDGWIFRRFRNRIQGWFPMPKYRNIKGIKGKGKGDLWSISSNLRTVTIFID